MGVTVKRRPKAKPTAKAKPTKGKAKRSDILIVVRNTLSKHQPPASRFRVSVETDDDTGEAIAAYFQIRKGKQDHAQDFARGAVIADYNKQGHLLGLELLASCSVKIIDTVAQNESAAFRASIKRFMRQSGPRGLVAIR